VDSLSWEGTSGGQSVQSVTNRVLAAAQPGEIVLMHLGSNPDDGTTLDAAALPAIIEGLRAHGYGFVPAGTDRLTRQRQALLGPVHVDLRMR
jgi:peptidoglycan/xylan/chitin deacetylase (PgdA/CDA1 family)